VPVSAVILAAGRGTRLGLASKPLAIVGGRTLLEHAVSTAEAAGIERIVVVVDEPDGPVGRFCRARLPFVELAHAHDCARGNGASVLAGLAHAGGRCLVMMVDHLHGIATVERLLRERGEFVFAVDSRAAYVDHADATLVRWRKGEVLAIGKDIGAYNAVETGLALCRAEPLVELGAGLEGDLSFNRLKHAWLETGRRIEVLDIEGATWFDIDTPADRTAAIAELVNRHGPKATDGPVARLLNRPLSKRVSRRLLRTRIAPNGVTVANLVLLLLAGAALALGAHQATLLVTGGILVQLASALDGVDGEIARVSGRTSALGAVLDAVCDRYGDLVVLLGAALAAGGDAAWPWAFGALTANWQLSFLRREHERLTGAVPASHIRFQWSRDVRLLVLAVGCVLQNPLGALVVWAVIGNVDALRRLVALIRASRHGDSPRTRAAAG
jgi:1L-myo-inositol 1-phosphate cytidylyltransferase / CDP-L-myo-inositol myo-inositolphosphotransferase